MCEASNEADASRECRYYKRVTTRGSHDMLGSRARRRPGATRRRATDRRERVTSCPRRRRTPARRDRRQHPPLPPSPAVRARLAPVDRDQRAPLGARRHRRDCCVTSDGDAGARRARARRPARRAVDGIALRRRLPPATGEHLRLRARRAASSCALDVATGASKWTVTRLPAIRSAPLWRDGRLVVAAAVASVRACRGADGTRRLAADARPRRVADAPVIDGDSLFVPWPNDDARRVRRQAAGRAAWTHAARGHGPAPLLAANGRRLLRRRRWRRLRVPASGRRPAGLAIHTGARRSVGAPVADGHASYVALLDNTVRALDAEHRHRCGGRSSCRPRPPLGTCARSGRAAWCRCFGRNRRLHVRPEGCGTPRQRLPEPPDAPPGIFALESR